MSAQRQAPQGQASRQSTLARGRSQQLQASRQSPAQQRAQQRQAGAQLLVQVRAEPFPQPQTRIPRNGT